MTFSYLKFCLKSGNTEELLSSSFCSSVGSLIRPSLSHILLKEHFLLPKPLLIRKKEIQIYKRWSTDAVAFSKIRIA